MFVIWANQTKRPSSLPLDTHKEKEGCGKIVSPPPGVCTSAEAAEGGFISIFQTQASTS